MKARSDPLTADEHRRLGIDLFNKTWTLMETADRNAEQNDELLHCAHASAYHWLQGGELVNRVRSEWQCARAPTRCSNAPSQPSTTHVGAWSWRNPRRTRSTTSISRSPTRRLLARTRLRETR